MSEWEDHHFDPDLVNLLLSVESRWQELDEMSSSINADSEAALEAEAVHEDPLCCQFSGRVTSANSDAMNELLEVALSKEFRK